VAGDPSLQGTPTFLATYAGLSTTAGPTVDLEAMMTAQWGVICDSHLLERALRRLPPPTALAGALPAPLPHFFDVHVPWVRAGSRAHCLAGGLSYGLSVSHRSHRRKKFLRVKKGLLSPKLRMPYVSRQAMAGSW